MEDAKDNPDTTVDARIQIWPPSWASWVPGEGPTFRIHIQQVHKKKEAHHN